MGRKNPKKSKRRFWFIKVVILCFIMILLISGCGQTVNAGSVPKKAETITNTFGTETMISWFNGSEQKTGYITVSKPVTSQPETLILPEDLKKATPELCSLWFSKITGDNVSEIRPLYAGDTDGHTFIRGNTFYPALGYALEDGWYAFPVPNGIKEFSICVGNGIFYSTNDVYVPEPIEQSIEEGETLNE